MADTTMLRQNAIVKNASVGVSPPHGPVKTGELPLVNVKQPPGGPQIQEGQQKPVTILPPKDADSAVKTGGLPMVKVKMTDGKPKPDNGVDEKVVIRSSKHDAVSAGALPMIQVKMADGKPQLQTLPNVQGGPPQIPAAAPALSAPRAAAGGRSGGYVARPALPTGSQVRVTRIAAPQAQIAAAQEPQRALPSIPDMSVDQLMLCRHLVEKYLGEIRAEADASATDAAGQDAIGETVKLSEAVLKMIQLAEITIATIDDVLVATAVRAEAAALAAAPPPSTIEVTASTSIAPTPSIAASASTSIAPAPSVAHNAGRVAGPFVAAGSRGHRGTVMAPRRVARDASAPPLPMVEVNMVDKRPVVQNQAEIAAAKAQVVAGDALTSEVGSQG